MEGRDKKGMKRRKEEGREWGGMKGERKEEMRGKKEGRVVRKEEDWKGRERKVKRTGEERDTEVSWFRILRLCVVLGSETGPSLILDGTLRVCVDDDGPT